MPLLDIEAVNPKFSEWAGTEESKDFSVQTVLCLFPQLILVSMSHGSFHRQNILGQRGKTTSPRSEGTQAEAGAPARLGLLTSSDEITLGVV